MSRLKIKNPLKKTKAKQLSAKFRNACLEQLEISKNEIKEKDNKKVEELIKKKILKKDGSYKHVKNVATDLGWSTNRIFRALERLKVYTEIQEKIKRQIQASIGEERA